MSQRTQPTKRSGMNKPLKGSKGKRPKKSRSQRGQAARASKRSRVHKPYSVQGIKVQSQNAQEAAWLKMITNPGSSAIVRSPSLSPVVVAVTHIPIVQQMAYNAENLGRFSVIVRPSVLNPLIVNQTAARIPAAGYGTILSAGHQAAAAGAPRGVTVGFCTGSPLVRYSEEGATAQYSMQAGLSTWGGFTAHWSPLRLVTGSVLRFALTAKAGHSYQLLLAYGTTGAITLVDTLHPDQNGSANTTHTLAVVATDFWALRRVDHTGTPLSWDGAEAVDYKFTATGSYVPASYGVGSRGAFVRTEIADLGHLSNVRVTACSLKVTNTASQLNSGGNIISCLGRQRVIMAFSDHDHLVEGLSKINEVGRFYSGALAEGAYGFFVPDDATSYEPKEYYTESVEDNCLVISGQMDPGGSIRIEAHFVVEFYSPSPLFSKSATPVMTDHHKEIIRGLMMVPCVSGNPTHFELIRNALRSVGGWVWDNRRGLLAVAETAAALI